MKYEKSCGAVIFRRAEGWNVLLIRHTKGRHISFPKGHVEQGETEAQTAEREIREEEKRRRKKQTRKNVRALRSGRLTALFVCTFVVILFLTT